MLGQYFWLGYQERERIHFWLDSNNEKICVSVWNALSLLYSYSLVQGINLNHTFPLVATSSASFDITLLQRFEVWFSKDLKANS